MKEIYNKTDGYRESLEKGLRGIKSVGKNISTDSNTERDKIENLKNIKKDYSRKLLNAVIEF